MAFLAIATQRALLNQQYNFLSYQKSKIMRMADDAAEEALEIQNAKEEADEDYDADSDPEYCYYHQLDEQYQAESESIDTQLTAMKDMIDSDKTLITNGIKTSCTMNLSGS